MGKLFTHSTADHGKIKSVLFTVMAPEVIEKNSVCEITRPEAFENKNYVENGLMDPRMGVTRFGDICKTCSGNQEECVGHFGHINLAQDVFHISYVTTVAKILRCICYKCSKLLVDIDSGDGLNQAGDENRKRIYERYQSLKNIVPKSKRFEKMVQLSREVHRCKNDGCTEEQPKSYKTDGLKIEAILRNNNRENITPEAAKLKLERISDEHARDLGFEPEHIRPHWMILSKLPVVPPCVRPSIEHGTAGAGQDDLTYKLSDIVKTNNRLREKEKNGETDFNISETRDLLMLYVAQMMDNTNPKLTQAIQKSGRVLKCISSRLKGKEGRLRNNLMGKRVDFSARTVITPDPNLEIDQVGVPISIASNMTFPERVTLYNMERLKEKVENGSEYPGAKFIIHKDGTSVDVELASDEYKQLQPGYIVERHVEDDDLILFNRQPTLHKMSMMGHRVKVLPYSTFRLNVSVTSPYNADFDGDEMNLHLPQSLGAKAELQEMMMVSKNIVSTQGNAPVIAIVQDALLGSVLMTKRDVFLEKDIMMNCCMRLKENFNGELPQPCILKPKQLWSGKQLFSLVLKGCEVNLFREANQYDDVKKIMGKEFDEDICPMDTKVVISRGELISGVADKRTLGKGGGSLIHTIFNEYSFIEASNFLNTLQWVVNYWMLQHGYSIGVEDTIADENTADQVQQTLSKAHEEVSKYIKEAQEGKLKSKPGMSLQESFEAAVNKTLNDSMSSAGKNSASSLSKRNRIKTMVVGGSKGSNTNISQIIACVGQQNIEGKRITFGFRKRTLPHFEQNDHRPISRGFVQNSYLRGLLPQEFFFHTMGGREGLIDTAVKTAKTGYIQRRLIKSMEDFQVKYDGTVRDSAGNILQFLYGEDGMDGVKLESQYFGMYKMSDKKFSETYQYETKNGSLSPEFGSKYLSQKIHEEFVTTPSRIHILEAEYQQLLRDRELLRDSIFSNPTIKKLCQPVNIKRLLLNASKKYLNRGKSDLDPIVIIQKVEELSKKLVVISGDDYLAREAQQNATILVNILIRFNLASKVVITKHKLNANGFEWILGEIETTFKRAFVQPGEMVGALAAQSIGEPATQMTLNTFHFAGVSAKNVTLGVPRLEELINVSESIKTPTMTIYLKEKYNNVKSLAEMKKKLVHMTLSTLVHETAIYYDPDISNSVIESDRSFLEDVMMDDDVSYSPWVLRVVLDKDSFNENKFEMNMIQSRIEIFYDNRILCFVSDDNADELVIRIRFVLDSDQQVRINNGVPDSEAHIRTLKDMERLILYQLPLRGVKHIQNIVHDDVKRDWFNPKTGQIEKKEEYVVLTTGTNLAEVLCIEEVHWERTVTNDIKETLALFGIEAARAQLLAELRAVIESSGYVNYRHLSMLVDMMTRTGEFTPITRTGVNKSDAGPLMKCSYEQTTEVLLKASAFAEIDNMRGVSANIIHGQLSSAGTGSFDIVMDLQKIQDVQPFNVTRDNYFAAQNTSMQDDQFQDYQNIPLADGSATPYHHGFANSPFHGGATPMAQPSPMMSPENVGFSPDRPSSPGSMSPNNMVYSPQSPQYTPSSPTYSPASPTYSPASPSYTPASPSYSPASPSYSPASPSYSPASPSYSPSSPSYSPSSPSYSPSSPSYSPSSPSYSPSSPSYSPSSPSYSPSSPSYSPSSPSYSPSSTSDSKKED
mmetsp:Transcript_4461/g.6549  ORF Transcript_4461/g.6549 Transcript_4461/m.6549 type:complete len:1672 (+) Transcript_4461:139-5154(+)